jgi:hypothetical protein
MSSQNDHVEIRLKKIPTSMGYRLKIESTQSDESIRIDPLALEALSWQEFDSRIADADSDYMISTYKDGELVTPPHEIRFRNEFALAIVNVTESAVEVTSPKIGHTNKLSPVDLEWLSQQSPEIFSEFLENPLGSDSS